MKMLYGDVFTFKIREFNSLDENQLVSSSQGDSSISKIPMHRIGVYSPLKCDL